MWRIGLTGGIGSGKSTVLQMLARRGAAPIDADAISRGMTATGGAAMPEVARTFGADFVSGDGSLDRARMRAHVFTQPQARHQLEALIHPLVGAEITRQVDAARALGRACVVFDIPLLVESGRWRAQLDRVLVIDCAPETQVQRVMARSGLQHAEVEAIIAAQAPRAQRLAAADAVICNEGLPLAQLEAEVAQLAKTFGL